MAESFYAPIPEQVREDLLRDYLAFLDRRNGATDPSAPYPAREAWLTQANADPLRYAGEVDVEWFQRNYAQWDERPGASLPLMTLLTFVKVNAGEAYGVEVVSSKRHRRPPGPGAFDQIERVLSREETYHTRILVGATHQFGLPSPEGAWTPPAALKVLIGSLAYAPKALFHPILLASELSGVFVFNFMLRKLAEVFPDQPQLREALEARMVEILVDEIGHVAFNRLAVGPTGLSAARKLAPLVARSVSEFTPEFKALGWTTQTLQGFDRFDYRDLPEEVRRRSFFA